MPYKCCVTACQSNYYPDQPYVTVFAFPDDEERSKIWKLKIPRENLVVNKNTRVCIKHFEDRYVVRQFEKKNKDGTVSYKPRKILELSEDAVPTLFPSLPSYLSSSVPNKRKKPDERRQEIDQRDDAVLNAFLNNDLIKSYENFKQGINTWLKSEFSCEQWIQHNLTSATIIYTLEEKKQYSVVRSVCKS
jgi:hypothetical protein